MKFKGFYTIATALSLIVTPTLAASAPISTPLTSSAAGSVSADDSGRGDAERRGDNDEHRRGGGGFRRGPGLIIALLALAAVIAGIIAISTNNKKTPTSA